VTALDDVRYAYSGEKLSLRYLSISSVNHGGKIQVKHAPDVGFLKQFFVCDFMEGDVERE
jgi:hypothetical protein